VSAKTPSKREKQNRTLPEPVLSPNEPPPVPGKKNQTNVIANEYLISHHRHLRLQRLPHPHDRKCGLGKNYAGYTGDASAVGHQIPFKNGPNESKPQ
jgi:hypothetical protein